MASLVLPFSFFLFLFFFSFYEILDFDALTDPTNNYPLHISCSMSVLPSTYAFPPKLSLILCELELVIGLLTGKTPPLALVCLTFANA